MEQILLHNLILRISNGDKDAFTYLFDLYKDKVYSVSLKLTQCNHKAEDIVQDVFLKLWMNKEELINIKNFESYLFVMIRNRVYTELKTSVRNKRLANEMSFNTEIYHNETLTTIIEREYSQILDQAISRLSFQQRQVYLLSREQDMTREEIAKLLNISQETVKTHLSRALKNIRAYSIVKLDLLQTVWLIINFV
jgi:RNA polymerase sigma-70 factor (family 1)